MSPLPKSGDQIQFKGGELWAFHTNCIENAKNLIPGELYTIDTIEAASSWIKVTLKEVPTQGKFGDDWFALHFFQWPRCQVMRDQSELAKLKKFSLINGMVEVDNEEIPVNGKLQCRNPAEWNYMPASERGVSEFCSDCLARLSNYTPCSCEVIFVPGVDVQTNLETGETFDIGENPPKNEENISWKWLDKDKSWCKIDEKGRPYPCCEYSPTDYNIRKNFKRNEYN